LTHLSRKGVANESMGQPTHDATGAQTGWKKVTKSFKVQGGARRDPAAVTVSQHGAGSCIVAATEIFYRTAVARNIDPSLEFLIDVAVDEVREMVAVWATAESTPGTSTIHRYKKGPSSWVAFLLGASFAEAPRLRPAAKRSGTWSPRTLRGFSAPLLNDSIDLT
jgi:hypothetical protein